MLGRGHPDGFTFVLRVPRGAHTLYIHAHSALAGRVTVVTLALKIFDGTCPHHPRQQPARPGLNPWHVREDVGSV
jgi:hypothetical protein